MGRFSSMGRRDKDPKEETDKTGSRDSADGGQSQSWSKTSVTSSSNRGLDGDQRSQKRESASGSAANAQNAKNEQGDNSMATIGQSIVFKGELTGDEDLEIDGQVEGTVNLKNHQLTIGPNGNLKAEVTAKNIVVIGRVTGNLVAAERIEIQATGIIDGDVRAPRLNVQEGAVLNGSIDMSPSGASEVKKPAAQAAASSASSTSNTASPPA